jgi:predicted NACHT family NTPase
MVKRSLQACPSRLHQAKRAFALKGWTQENLAGEVNLKTRQPIWRFFTGQPVERQIFVEICGILDLDWREIAVDPPAEFPELDRRGETAPLNIDELVGRVRDRVCDTLRDRCGVLQLLDLGRPVWIEDIYIDVNVFDRISAHQWYGLADLQQVTPDRSIRHRAGTTEERHQLSATQAAQTYTKLKVVGRPGTGKTMLLKHLAIQCDRGEFAADRVPIYIALTDFAEEASANGKFDLLAYLYQLWAAAGSIDSSWLETLLQEGRVLLLIDGMDEVGNRELNATLKEFRKFADKYHKNQYVVACRTGARNTPLRGFTEVEIAPFARAQIANFAHKWFTTVADCSPPVGRTRSLELLQQLDVTENWQIRQLVTTPLFLHLACGIFHARGKFPAQRIEFYDRVLNLLLSEWDAAKGIDRRSSECGLTLPQTLRLLSHLAAATFERGRYFSQRREIERYIGDFLRSLPGQQLTPEAIQLESTALLGQLETQHGLPIECARGIFSFGAPIFQEYLTAHKIVAEDERGGLEHSLRQLVRHFANPQWHEAFVLTAAMLRNADELVQLIHQQIDLLVDREPSLQEFLLWLDRTTTIDLSRSHHQSAWVQQLKTALADYQNTHDSWQLSTEREQLLQAYCYANQLAIDCATASTTIVGEACAQRNRHTEAYPQIDRTSPIAWIPPLVFPQRSPELAEL